MTPEQVTDPNTFRILVSTDNHVGFAEKDGIRGQDSFTTFEEILHLAVSNNVDFVLFAGDIFHESRPSMPTIHEVMRILRLYCLGSRPVSFELLSDCKTVFANTAIPNVNYLDKNLNIALPVFAIHGNHDDPAGPGGLCAADLLHTGGLINLFGKHASVERIDLNPILLRKGDTRIAIYGLGAVREERLHRLFLSNNVTFYRPTENADDWFSLCAVHQNRVRHGPTSYLPENFLPNFLDLVVWGHEHECRIEPEWNSTQNFYVTQPGSSVATSLSNGEAGDKAVGLLEIRGKEFKMTRLPLRTVRPLLFRDLVLQEIEPKLDPAAFDVAKSVEMICSRYIEDEIAKATSAYAEALATTDTQSEQEPTQSRLDMLRADQKSNLRVISRQRLLPPPEPLIRLRVDLSGGFESFGTLRFGQKFVGRVANPKDLIVFNRNQDKLAAAQANRALKSDLQNISTNSDEEMLAQDNQKVGLDAADVEDLVRQYLLQMAQPKGYASAGDQVSNGLAIFTTLELGRSLRRYVDRGVRDAIQTEANSVLTKTLRYLRVRQAPEERIITDVLSYSNSRYPDENQTDHHLDTQFDENEEEMVLTEKQKPVRNQPITSTTASKQKELNWSFDEDEDVEQELESPPHGKLEGCKVKIAKGRRNPSRAGPPKKSNPVLRKPGEILNTSLNCDSDDQFDAATAAADDDDDVDEEAESRDLANLVEDDSDDDRITEDSGRFSSYSNATNSLKSKPILPLLNCNLTKTNPTRGRGGRGRGRGQADRGTVSRRRTSTQFDSENGRTDSQVSFEFRRKRTRFN